jgi:hypothetical protein
MRDLTKLTHKQIEKDHNNALKTDMSNTEFELRYGYKVLSWRVSKTVPEYYEIKIGNEVKKFYK